MRPNARSVIATFLLATPFLNKVIARLMISSLNRISVSNQRWVRHRAHIRFWHHGLLLRFLITRHSEGTDRVLLNLAVQCVLIPRARGSIGVPDAEKRFAVGGVLRTLPGLVVGFEEDRLDSVRRRPALDGLVVPLGLLRAGKEGIGPAGSRGWASPFRRFEFQLPPSGLRRHF